MMAFGRAWVWLSSPVTMFPTARNAGVCTSGDVWSLVTA